jgi:hypothetical protein
VEHQVVALVGRPQQGPKQEQLLQQQLQEVLLQRLLQELPLPSCLLRLLLVVVVVGDGALDDVSHCR